MEKTNVFGDAITEGTRSERITKACKDPNAGRKKEKAIEYVKEEKKNYGNGSSTLCIFYNATGETLTYTQDHPWYGKIYDKYPTIVKNGQWGAYLHVKKAVVASGSVGAVEYRGMFNNTDYCKYLIGWDTPWDQVTQNNHAYGEIYEDDKKPDWDKVYDKMEESGRQHVATGKRMIIISTIEEASSPLYEATITDEDYVTIEAKARAADA